MENLSKNSILGWRGTSEKNSILQPSRFSVSAEGDNVNYKTQSTEPAVKTNQQEKKKSHKTVTFKLDNWQTLQKDGEKLKKWIELNETRKRVQSEKHAQTLQVIKTLKTKLSDSQLFNEKLNQKVKENETENEKYFCEFQACQEGFTRVKQNLEIYSQRLESCENMKCVVNEINATQLDKINNLTTEFQNLEVTHRKKITSLESQIVNIDLEKNRVINAYEMEVNNLKVVVESLKMKLSKCGDELNELTCQLEHEKHERKIINDERDDLLKAKGKIENRLSKMNDDFISFKEEHTIIISAKENEIEELKLIQQANNEKLDNLQNEIEMLKDKIQTQALKNTELQDNVEEITAKNKEYRIKAVKTIKKYDRLKMQMEKEFALRSKETKDLRQQIENLNFDLSKESEEKTKFEEECESLRNEVTGTVTTYKAKYEEILLNKDREIENISSKLSEELKEKEEINKKNAEEVLQLKTDFEKSKAILLSQQNSIDQKQVGTEKKLTEMQYLLKEKELEIDILKKTNDLVEKKIQELITANGIGKKEIKDLKEANVRAEETILSLKEAIKATEKQNMSNTAQQQNIESYPKGRKINEVAKSVKFMEPPAEASQFNSTDTSAECFELELFPEGTIANEKSSDRLFLKTRNSNVAKKSCEMATKTTPINSILKRTSNKGSAGRNDLAKKSKLSGNGDSLQKTASNVTNATELENAGSKEANVNKKLSSGVGDRVQSGRRFFKYSLREKNEIRSETKSQDLSVYDIIE